MERPNNDPFFGNATLGVKSSRSSATSNTLTNNTPPTFFSSGAIGRSVFQVDEEITLNRQRHTRPATPPSVLQIHFSSLCERKTSDAPNYDTAVTQSATDCENRRHIPISFDEEGETPRAEQMLARMTINDVNISANHFQALRLTQKRLISG